MNSRRMDVGGISFPSSEVKWSRNFSRRLASPNSGSVSGTSRSSGHAERLREHIDDRFRQSGDERNPPEVRVQPPQDTGNAPGESRQSESAEQA